MSAKYGNKVNIYIYDMKEREMFVQVEIKWFRVSFALLLCLSLWLSPFHRQLEMLFFDIHATLMVENLLAAPNK